ncbi:hypothetical protein [Amycolatopsis nigrescens]|uniref:hypothetical protein n=1 Tax=Amycolatopsis nigrescens TaxID=381445 RepID=UPI00316ACDA0
MVVVTGWLLLGVLLVVAWPRIAADRAVRTGALLLTLAFSLVHQLLFAAVPPDAFITFRYAQNIADGNGAVFNAGERVEGYASFLWTVLIALPKTLFGSDIAATASVLSVCCALGCVLLAYLVVNRIVAGAERGSPALGVVAAALTAGTSGLAAYGASGTETPLFLLLVLGICYALAGGHPVVAGVLAALVLMTALEGAVLVLVAGLWLALNATRERLSWWAPAGYTLGALVLAVPWTAWRMTYYGHLTPNWLVAESGDDLAARLASGWPYLTGFSLLHQGFLLLALIAVVVLARWRGAGDKAARSLVWMIFVTAVLYTVIVTLGGGDELPAWRRLLPVPPLLAIGAAAACGLIGTRRVVPSPSPRRTVAGHRGVPVVTVGLVGLSLLVSISGRELLPRIEENRNAAAELGEIGGWLGERLPSGSAVATYANGALSYRAGTRVFVVDVRGRTDEYIARAASGVGPSGALVADYDYVVNIRRPAVAVTSTDGYADRQRCAIDPVYAGRYQVATFRREGTGQWIAVYPRSEQAGSLINELDADPRFGYVPCPS